MYPFVTNGLKSVIQTSDNNLQYKNRITTVTLNGIYGIKCVIQTSNNNLLYKNRITTVTSERYLWIKMSAINQRCFQGNLLGWVQIQDFLGDREFSLSSFRYTKGLESLNKEEPKSEMNLDQWELWCYNPVNSFCLLFFVEQMKKVARSHDTQ